MGTNHDDQGDAQSPEGLRLRGRRRRYPWEQKIRDKIQASQIVNRLIGHVHGEVELTASQVTAAIALMHKIIPNLIYAETYNINKTFVAELPAVASRESWDALAIEHQPEPKKDNLQ
jgi:hypothetical protein